MSAVASTIGRRLRSRLAPGYARVGEIAVFAVLPAVTVLTMLVVAVRTGPLAWDFRNELYPQAQAILDGRNPYPGALWPPLAAAVAMPFTAFPSETAGVVVAIAGLACMAGALWLVGVRDWRIYGVVGLWPPVLADIRIAHLTPLLCLLVALAWRFRDRRVIAGVAIGAAGALKFFLWPLGVWALATRRTTAAAVAAFVGAASLLVIAALAPIDEYVETLRAVTDRFDQDGYSTFGLLTRVGVEDGVARGATYALGAVLLVGVWRRRSFGLAVAAALVLSPIVWLDYFALAAVPLAVARPSLSPAWLLPLALWGLPSSGIATDTVWGVGRVLVVFAVVLLVAARAGQAHVARAVGSRD